MKTRKRLILVALVSVLGAALVAQAIMSGGRSGFTKDPNVAALVAQTTTSRGDDQSRTCIEKALPTGKITDRRSFDDGAWFAHCEIGKMRNEALRVAYDAEKHILAGLEGVIVVVEAVDPETAMYGLTRQLLQTDTEQRLRQNGIRVLSFEEVKKDLTNRKAERDKKSNETLWAKLGSLEESLDPKDSHEHFLRCLRESIRHVQPPQSLAMPPYLYINVNTSGSEETGVAALTIRVELKEDASLCRNGAGCVAAIWERHHMGICSSNILKESVRKGLRDDVDEFINDYLAANPKDRSSEKEQQP